jgi:cobalt/nickel transport protein
MRFAAILIVLALTLPANAQAGFGLMVPTDELVTQGESSTLGLRLGWFDPLAPLFTEIAKPKRFGVQHLGEETDLLASLKPAGEKNPTAWLADFMAKNPGDYTFYAEHAPRWVAADDQFTVPLAKVCVNVRALEEGWDEPVGLEAEIVPLSRPYGLWTGNLFSGQVLLNSEPVPYVAIEVAWLGTNPDTPPAPLPGATAYRLQKVRADVNGIFHYAMPRAGWWGFAAILDTDRTLKKDNEEKPVGIVTSFWVMTRDFKGD